VGSTCHWVGERAHTLSVLTSGWAEAETLTGPDCFPLALLFIFLLSSFSFFCFLISFLDFAKMFQSKSNSFQKFSKDCTSFKVNNKTSFQVKGVFSIKYYELGKRGLCLHNKK
jgi:hypothetical protein